MADKQFTIQVSHTVTEVYEVTAGSAVDANTKLGMVMGLERAGVDVPADLAAAVKSIKTTKTVKHIGQAKTMLDDDDPRATSGG